MACGGGILCVTLLYMEFALLTSNDFYSHVPVINTLIIISIIIIIILTDEVEAISSFSNSCLGSN